jgi:predicted histone-like DNA-binding protein
MATLEALIQVLPSEIAEGKIVQLGEFGSFGITLQSEGAETEEAFTASNIKRFSIRFRPGKIFKNTLNNAGYKKELDGLTKWCVSLI